MQNQIEEARVNLEQAEIDADVQYDSMKLRIQFMYERNEDTYLDILLSSSSLADLLNKADYITKISEYDRNFRSMKKRFSILSRQNRIWKAIMRNWIR